MTGLSDEERERQIRGAGLRADDAGFVLRRLDEAREDLGRWYRAYRVEQEEAARLREEVERRRELLPKTMLERFNDGDMPPRAPPGADAIEHVARAIFAEQLRHEDDSQKPRGWDDAHPNDRELAFALARVATLASEGAQASPGADAMAAIAVENTPQNRAVGIVAEVLLGNWLMAETVVRRLLDAGLIHDPRALEQYGEQAALTAREEAIAECAEIAERRQVSPHFADRDPEDDGQHYTAADIARSIRALGQRKP